ncbi:chemotaxis protein CheB [Pedobacter hiemivivus]|uniref:protein-glutamate methylesterase n=1 Tax=Pedobacter hiemivivus TaxID=2530454 RepID=A0A4U1FYW0_9SPHI|nr:chemotaxis protein CheB [Pedobacter hiemivivus]TKC56198.1 chemotaxis protein CheB [Pedobacter hiemivivus]
METTVKNIVTIGASAGGIAAITKLLSTVDKDLNAALFIVIHISKKSRTDVILTQLQKYTAFKCVIPKDGEDILNQIVYLAPSDCHMMVRRGKILIRKGALENHWRPSIDVLFRSAAAAYGCNVTGIVLTGLLDDGTSGMSAIKKSGGTCIVQDPAEADFPDMPRNVLQNVAVDYNVPIADMGYILSDLLSRGDSDMYDTPTDVLLENDVTMRMNNNFGDLVNKQLKGVEESLWVAIRMMEERKNLLNSMSDQNEEAKEMADQMITHIARLKKMLQEIGKKS